MKYYHAYDARYKAIHSHNLTWTAKEPTPELIQWVNYYKIPSSSEILEIGCGEGRDILYLSRNNFKTTGFDISQEAISYCKSISHKENLNIQLLASDFVTTPSPVSYHWIYSIGTLHMLVDDADRKSFLFNLSKSLKPGGKALLVNMGDGVSNYQTDTSIAFDLAERTHSTGTKMMVAGTSFRKVDWAYFRKEIENANLTIENSFLSNNLEYSQCMTAYLQKGY